MRESLKKYRSNYFQDIAKLIPSTNVNFVILTHILPDRPELLESIASIGTISLIIAIPYSIDEETLQVLNKKYNILLPNFFEIMSPDIFYDCVFSSIPKLSPIIILEIGGYFAPIIHRLRQSLGDNLLGVIEDTETGHRQYQKLPSFPCPVISVARSPLKETEDFIVGSSCLFSTERLMREAGFLMDGKQALVLGFGKVGRGLSHALLRKACRVYVYDEKSIRRILALSEAFQIPNRDNALQESDFIFGATGNFSLKENDFKNLKNGSLLISCSSKKNEFDLEYLDNNYCKSEPFKGYTKYTNKHHYFYLLSNGTPINFLDNAVIGPVLSLVQSEIIIAIKYIIESNRTPGIYEVDKSDQQLLAEKWITCFVEPVSGGYING